MSRIYAEGTLRPIFVKLSHTGGNFCEKYQRKGGKIIVQTCYKTQTR